MLVESTLNLAVEVLSIISNPERSSISYQPDGNLNIALQLSITKLIIILPIKAIERQRDDHYSFRLDEIKRNFLQN